MRMFLLNCIPGGHIHRPDDVSSAVLSAETSTGGEASRVRLLMSSEVSPKQPGMRPGRCLMMQAPAKEDTAAYAATLGPLPSGDLWEIYELVPNEAPQFLYSWFGGKFAKGHR